MKRKDIVAKLMKEGLSEKILAPMSDKQLNMLAKRLISEQIPSPTPNSAGTPTIPLSSLKTNPEQAKKMANAGIKFIAAEEIEASKLGSEKKEKTDKETIIARSNAKIKQAIKDGKPYTDYTRAIKHVNNGELPESTKSIIGNKDKSLNEWVQNIVEKNYHPFTSKNEIMELIQSKLTEQHNGADVETLPDFLTGDAIMDSQTAEPTTKPITKPGTKPTTRPTPKTPFQPGPGPKHNPKAKAKI